MHHFELQRIGFLNRRRLCRAYHQCAPQWSMLEPVLADVGDMGELSGHPVRIEATLGALAKIRRGSSEPRRILDDADPAIRQLTRVRSASYDGDLDEACTKAYALRQRIMCDEKLPAPDPEGFDRHTTAKLRQSLAMRSNF